MIRALVAAVLIRDPELRTAKNGAPFVTALGRASAGGESHLVNMAAFGPQADALGKLRAGDALSVVGSCSPRAWLKDGEPKASISVTVDQIVSLPSGKPAAPRRRRAQPRPQPSQPVGDGKPFNDELPW